MRYLVVKCGHKDVAMRELAGLKETFARISGTPNTHHDEYSHSSRTSAHIRS
jgi:hypothetical protein